MWNLFYRNPRLLALTIVLIIVSGLAAYNLLPRKEDPTLTKRNVLILTRFPGANAERVEALVTDKIEAELREMEEIPHTPSLLWQCLHTLTGHEPVCAGFDHAFTRLQQSAHKDAAVVGVQNFHEAMFGAERRCVALGVGHEGKTRPEPTLALGQCGQREPKAGGVDCFLQGQTRHLTWHDQPFTGRG